MYRKNIKLNNRGSALVTVLAIVSLITLLGAAGLSAASVNVRMRAMNRISDHNFYRLETIWDEIYEKLGQTASEKLKEDYSVVLARLYQKDYETNAEANCRFGALFTEQLTQLLWNGDSSCFAGDGTPESSDMQNICETAAAYIGSLWDGAAEGEALKVSIDQIQALPADASDTTGASGSKAFRGVLLQGLNLQFTDASGAASAITLDLELSAPEIRFIDSTKIFSDYILIANGEINIESNSGTKAAIRGNVCGKNINIRQKSDVTMNGSTIIAENITVDGRSTLALGQGEDTLDEDDDADSEKTTSGFGGHNVWADNLIVSGNASTLTSTDTSFFVRDDLTINQNNSTVELNGGSYYGYGNEGTSSGRTYRPAVSSAMILNGTGNTLKLNLDSLTLAGRSYMKVDDSQAYPMAESIAQKHTQSIYRVPPNAITSDDIDSQITNPLLFPPGKTSISITVTLDDIEYGPYTIAKDQEGLLTQIGDNGDKVVILKRGTGNGSRIYVFYNVDYGTDSLKDYFKDLTEADESTFLSLLEKAGNEISLEGIQKSGGNVVSAGAIYQYEKNDGAQLLDTNSTSTLNAVSTANMLSNRYDNLRNYLTITTPAVRDRKDLPAGQYVKSCKSAGKENIILNGQPMRDVIIAKGDVAISGKGSFSGLIISFGNIYVGGEVELNADSDVVQSCLAGDYGQYFYDYSQPAATALNDYSCIVKESNWYRGRRTTESTTENTTEGTTEHTEEKEPETNPAGEQE